MDMKEPARAGLAGEREALNAAFWDLGLRFQWDAATWGVLVEMDDLETQLRYYLEHWQPHLLAVYDPKFLAGAVEARMATPDAFRMGMEAFAKA